MLLRLADATLGYDDAGEGTAVVFLHAFPLDRTMWAPQLDALTSHARCITMDMRGVGESTGAAAASMDVVADDTVALLDALGVARAVVVGLSMGGYAALALWRRYASRVRALVLADTRAGADSDEGKQRRMELIELALREGAAAIADRQLTGLLGKTTRARQPEIANALRKSMSGARVDGIVWALEAMMRREDSTPLLPTIDVPALLVAGDEDVLTPPKEARSMHERIAGSRLELIPQAGHLSNIERPAAFNALLAEFLAGLEAS